MPAQRKSSRKKTDPTIDALEAIKRLLVLQLMSSGVQSVDIASALGVNKSTVSKLVPMRKVKRSKKK